MVFFYAYEYQRVVVIISKASTMHNKAPEVATSARTAAGAIQGPAATRESPVSCGNGGASSVFHSRI